MGRENRRGRMRIQKCGKEEENNSTVPDRELERRNVKGQKKKFRVRAANCPISNFVLCLSSATGSEKVIFPFSSIFFSFYHADTAGHIRSRFCLKPALCPSKLIFSESLNFLRTRERKSTHFALLRCQIDVYCTRFVTH